MGDLISEPKFKIPTPSPLLISDKSLKGKVFRVPAANTHPKLSHAIPPPPPEKSKPQPGREKVAESVAW